MQIMLRAEPTQDAHNHHHPTSCRRQFFRKPAECVDFAETAGDLVRRIGISSQVTQKEGD